MHGETETMTKDKTLSELRKELIELKTQRDAREGRYMCYT